MLKKVTAFWIPGSAISDVRSNPNSDGTSLNQSGRPEREKKNYKDERKVHILQGAISFQHLELCLNSRFKVGMIYYHLTITAISLLKFGSNDRKILNNVCFSN